MAGSQGIVRDEPQPRVLLIGNYAPDAQLSMLRFGATLLEGLRALGQSADLIAPGAIARRHVPGASRVARLLGHVDKYLLFPLALRLRARRYDVVHILDHSNAPYRQFVGRTPVLLTCHDLFAVQIMLGQIPGERFGLGGRLLQRWILRNLARIGRFTSVSVATAADLRRLTGTSAPIEVIPNALPPVFAGPQPEESHRIVGSTGLAEGVPYLLHVGGNNFYKNRGGVLRLFEELAALPGFADHVLVLAGHAPDRTLREAIDRSAVRARVRIVTDASDEALRELYAGAVALLFPSLREGFGWPIVEAQACGCVVVTTDAEPMRSVAGGAAVLIDPADPARAAAMIEQAVSRFADLREDGLRNAARYRSEEVFSRYPPLYRSAAASR